MKELAHLPGVDIESLPARDVAKILALAKVEPGKAEKMVREEYPAKSPGSVAVVEQGLSGYGFIFGIWCRVTSADVIATRERLEELRREYSRAIEHYEATVEAERLGKIADRKLPPDESAAIFLAHLSHYPAFPQYEANLTIGRGPELPAGTPDGSPDASGAAPATVETVSTAATLHGGPAAPDPAPAISDDVAAGGSTLRSRVPRPVPAKMVEDMRLRPAVYVGSPHGRKMATSRTETAVNFDGSPFVGEPRPLSGATALVMPDEDDSSGVLAQFDDTRTGYGFGWHKFGADEFAMVSAEEVNPGQSKPSQDTRVE